ncbi:hypothetical protein [Dawidia soli]|uniref:Uncharacterized protein n=1 Tax=Dawidia soli TaxID=2782352 RepID=A0AAP2GE49_9BACT|nr:hypothetical protein [Dawidia soli]MBT1688009.1 hypothetical protein [Dawidia soli]
MAIYLFKKTVYNCKQATLLSLKKEAGAASWWERFKLWYHLLRCDPCRNFIQQSHLITQAGQKMYQEWQQRPPHALSAERRELIRKELESLH